MALLERLLDGKIRRGTLTIRRADGSSVTLGAPSAGWPDAKLIVKEAGAERRILLNPRLGLAEAYMDGAVDVDVGVNVDEDEDSRCLKILEYFHAWMRTAVPTA